MSNVKVILGEECASQHRLLVGDFRVSIPPQPKRKFVPSIKVWKLRDPGKQAELSKVFKAKTLDSELSQTSTVDERWTSLKDKLLQATKQVCGVSSNHPWRKQTWWWNNQVEEAVREKRRCFKLWKAGGSWAAYNTAKRTSNRAVHQARGEAEKVALQKIGLEMYIDLPSKCVVTIRMPWERNLLIIAGQLSLDEEAKKEAWREHYERLLNVEFPWNPEDLSEESPVEGPSEPITLEMITKAISKIASGKAAGPSGIVAEMLKPVGEAGAVEVRDLIEDIILEDAFQLTGRKASLSICTRAKGML